LCRLAFDVARDGSISNIQVIGSSGSETVDGYAIKALKETERLAPFPDTVPKSRLRLTVTFDFSGA